MQVQCCFVDLAACLEEVLPELLEIGDSVLPFLPSHCKAALLARAKRLVSLLAMAQRGTASFRPAREPGMYRCMSQSQDLVDDRALGLLADADWSVLDASDCARLTDDGLLSALRLAPDLRWLDITGCNGSAVVLRALPTLCPGITVLRLGELGGLCFWSPSVDEEFKHFWPCKLHCSCRALSS